MYVIRSMDGYSVLKFRNELVITRKSGERDIWLIIVVLVWRLHEVFCKERDKDLSHAVARRAVAVSRQREPLVAVDFTAVVCTWG